MFIVIFFTRTICLLLFLKAKNIDYPISTYLSFGEITMTIDSDSDYELSSIDDLDFNDDESKSEFDNNVADFDLNTASTEGKSSKHA